jgi:hypothetical protein
VLFFRMVAVKQKRPSFSVSVEALKSELDSLGVSVGIMSLPLGSFLSETPISVLMPEAQKKNQFQEAVMLPCLEWLESTAPFPLRESKIVDLVSLCYPEVDQKMLLAALVDITGLFIYDDYIDRIANSGEEAKLELQTQQAWMHHAFMEPLSYLQNPVEEQTKFGKMVAEMGRFLLDALPSNTPLQDVHIAFSGYLDAMVDETSIRTSFVSAYSTGDMSDVLSSDERHFLRIRSRSSGVEFVFALCAVFDGFSIAASGARGSYIVDNVVTSCGDAIGVFNDIVTLRKDLVEGLTENLVLIVAEKSFFSQNSLLFELQADELRSCLFYRDLCTVKSLNESPDLLQSAIVAIQKKYNMQLNSETLDLFLTRDLNSVLSGIEASLPLLAGVGFKRIIFESWIQTLKSAIKETADKYFNKEVISFYKSIDSCKQAAKTTPHRFTPELFRYFDRLETWLSGSSWWSVDPKNKRYNWWLT